MLHHCRFDKVKPVREATLETIKLLKEIGPPLSDKELGLIEDKPKKAGPPSHTNRERGSGSNSARMRKGQDGSLSDDQNNSFIKSSKGF